MPRFFTAALLISFAAAPCAFAQDPAPPADPPLDHTAEEVASPGPGRAEPLGVPARRDPREEVERRLASLRGDRYAEVAAQAFDHAERALLRCDSRRAEGDVRGADRALEIARAALVLADRQIDRAREEEALATAQEMAEIAAARARAAAEALAVAQRRWEARQRGEDEPAEGPPPEPRGSPADPPERRR